MTLNAEEKKSLSKYRLEKADALLNDAALLLREGRWGSSINRSYYAALNAAKGALILFGVDPKTHDGVKTMVNKHLILDGFMPKEYGKWFRSLLVEREEADYADYVTVDSSDAEDAFGNASRFIERIKEIVPVLVQQL